jgi:hypothetical protein
MPYVVKVVIDKKSRESLGMALMTKAQPTPTPANKERRKAA